MLGFHASCIGMTAGEHERRCVVCGLPPDPRNDCAHCRPWTRETALAALREYAARLGARPTYEGYRRRPAQCPSRDTLVKLFGTWSAAVEAAGFEARPRGTPVRRQWSPEDPCANPNCERLCGTNGSAGRCNGCARHLTKLGTERVPMRPRRDHGKARETIAAELRALAGELGHVPSDREWRAYARERGLPVSLQSYFGGTGEAQRAAGLPPNRRGYGRGQFVGPARVERVARALYRASGGDEVVFPWPCARAEFYRGLARAAVAELS